MTIEDRVKKIIAEQFNVDIHSIEPDHHFTDDLGADSLDIVELIMVFEEEFDTEILDDEAEYIMRVQDAIHFIKRYV